jgi:hypothetical protein
MIDILNRRSSGVRHRRDSSGEHRRQDEGGEVEDKEQTSEQCSSHGDNMASADGCTMEASRFDPFGPGDPGQVKC